MQSSSWRWLGARRGRLGLRDEGSPELGHKKIDLEPEIDAQFDASHFATKAIADNPQEHCRVPIPGRPQFWRQEQKVNS
jgi:hypothetical protein